MTAPLQTWTVSPHRKPTLVGGSMLTVTGNINMPLMELPRRMTVVRLRDARLVVYSAIALDEDEMEALEVWGRPTFLVVPSDHHRMDAKIWKDRYPAMQVVAPRGARAKVEELVHVDTVAPEFKDLDVDFMTVPGTRGHEAALMVRSASGCSLILNDVVGNIRDAKGFGGWLLRIAGFAGDEPNIPAVVKLTVVDDTAALRLQLMEWAAIPTLTRIIVSHGDIIEDNPRQVLRELAASLD
ncbi:MAG: hypothetical protein V4627_12885 [Pseudomonadota bacterium]